MKKKCRGNFRYGVSGPWYKGNTHLHSTASDGGKTFVELEKMYAGVGYDFLFRTDHCVLSNVAEDRRKHPLLWLDGVELHGKDARGSFYHVVCLGTLRGIDCKRGFVKALRSARAQGALLILAHPYWTGNTLEDARRLRFDGVEIYNHVCHWLNGKGDGGVHWNWMLERSPRTLGFAADDAHIGDAHPGWNGGWIVVKAPRLERDAIETAIRRGNFYSSCGPEFHSIQCRGNRVRIRTSPVRFVRLVGPRWRSDRKGSFGGRLLTEAAFDIPADWSYAYLEIEDAHRRRAWTNSLFVA